MFNLDALKRIDFRSILILVMLMLISLLVISSMTQEGEHVTFFTTLTKAQIKRFFLGMIGYLFFVCIDYQKLREVTWFLYFGTLILLVGLFFVSSIQHVHRWYRLPILQFGLQPSENAKLILVMALSWFLEKYKGRCKEIKMNLFALAIVFIPFFLILKQPDLGTALILLPIALVMFYFGDIHPVVLKSMTLFLFAALMCIASLFLGVISHKELHPIMTKILREYQYERLNPDTYHQKASQTAIALGKVMGNGWRQADYAAGGWLPAAHTDSVFAAYVEEFGMIGAFFLLSLFFALIYFSFRVANVAKDDYGRLLAVGIATYIAIHVLINVGMMTGFIPITGVPLILISYGGSSIISTMCGLGILQSIYIRRFTF